MANPQKENGHVDIANEIVEALAITYLSSYESQVLWAIFRKTYGWHKKEDWITGSQLVEMTGITKGHISRTLKKLIERNMVNKNGKKLSFQKDYDKWIKLSKQVTNIKLPIQDKKLPKQVTEVTQTGNKKLPKQVNTKETKETSSKENIQKKKDAVPPFIEEVINYLNTKADKDYGTTNKAHQKFINARIKEGYDLDAFKWVIDVKCAEWKDDKAMDRYLRPKTLFNSENFEGYLNETKFKKEKEDE